VIPTQYRPSGPQVAPLGTPKDKSPQRLHAMGLSGWWLPNKGEGANWIVELGLSPFELSGRRREGAWPARQMMT
jgi:hypothetical protein